MTEKMEYLRKLKPGKLLAQLQEIFNDLKDHLASAELLNQCYSEELRDILNHTAARDKSMRHKGAVLQAVLDMLAEHKHEVRRSKLGYDYGWREEISEISRILGMTGSPDLLTVKSEVKKIMDMLASIGSPESVNIAAEISDDIMRIEQKVPGVSRTEQAVRLIKAERKAFRDALQDVIVSPLECQCCVKMRAVAWKAVNPEDPPPQATATEPKHILPKEVKEDD